VLLLEFEVLFFADRFSLALHLLGVAHYTVVAGIVAVRDEKGCDAAVVVGDVFWEEFCCW